MQGEKNAAVDKKLAEAKLAAEKRAQDKKLADAKLAAEKKAEQEKKLANAKLMNDI